MDIQSKFFTYGENEESKLILHNGKKFGPITLAYETYGSLNKSKDNAVLVFHALSGSQHLAGFNSNVDGIMDRWTDECKNGWWDSFVGPGKNIDTDRFFVICVNYFGGCYGSTGPSSINPNTNEYYGSSFPKINFSDIVDSQIPLFKYLEIEKFHSVIGSSLGGIMALNFSTRYSNMTNNVISIASGLRAPILTKTHNLEQILAIENDVNFNNGDYYNSSFPNKGLMLARMISHKTFVSLRYMKSRMSAKCEQNENDFKWYKIKTSLESYLLHQGHKFSKRFDANTYAHLISAWSDFDLKKDNNADNDYDIFNDCSDHKYLIYTINSDCCFYPEEQEELYNALLGANIDVEYITVPSEKGHDSFLLEPELYSDGMQKILKL
ncbi:MAG: homoserine O-acetyltransferase [Pontiellaceae bacterium]